MIRSTLATLTKHIIGRVRRRTSAKQRSMMLVVSSFRRRCWVTLMAIYFNLISGQ
ncbi:MAG TPA: hypothetical protein VN577_11540 [Terriglobales bacterium]|nr:hypothetical protein [Terriglobales bacterium]